MQTIAEQRREVYQRASDETRRARTHVLTENAIINAKSWLRSPVSTPGVRATIAATCLIIAANECARINGWAPVGSGIASFSAETLERVR